MGGKPKISISPYFSHRVVLGSNMFFVELEIQMWAQRISYPFEC